MDLDVGSGGGPYDWHPRAEICLSYDLPVFKVKEQVIRGDAHNLPFHTKQFKTVYAYNLLEHVKNPMKVLRELLRVGYLVKLRQDSIFNIASYATPEHLWFQLPNLKFLPYPRTRIGIFISKMLRVLLTQAIPSLPRHHQLNRLIPRPQYDVSIWMLPLDAL